jgi:sporulation protein YlmC with PRC-barrel domain
MKMDLGRQVLDQQLVDRSNLNIGKVDGIVLELRDNEPPRVAAILTGGHVLARRLHPWIERAAARLTRRWGPTASEPFRIPWSKVKKIGVDVKVDIAADEVMPWEHWVRDHILRRIPGA